MFERRLEMIRKAKFNIDVAINLIDKAGDLVGEGQEMILVERAMSDLKYVQLRLSALNERVVEKSKTENV